MKVLLNDVIVYRSRKFKFGKDQVEGSACSLVELDEDKDANLIDFVSFTPAVDLTQLPKSGHNFEFDCSAYTERENGRTVQKINVRAVKVSKVKST